MDINDIVGKRAVLTRNVGGGGKSGTTGTIVSYKESGRGGIAMLVDKHFVDVGWTHHQFFVGESVCSTEEKATRRYLWTFGHHRILETETMCMGVAR